MLLSNQKINIDNIRAFTENSVKNGKGSEILTLVPTNRKARKTKKEFITLSPKRTLTTANIETLSTLATKLLAVKKVFHPLDDATSSYILRQSAESITPKYFRHYKENIFPRGTLEKIKLVISEYKRTGITPDALLEEVNKDSTGDAEKRKAFDIASIYAEYSRKCEELKALEIGDIYNALLLFSDNELSESFYELFPEVKIITLSFFREISVPEVKLLKRVCAVTNIPAVVELDYSESNGLIFEVLEPTIERLKDAGFTSVKNGTENDSRLLRLIKKNLFLPRGNLNPEPVKNIVVFSGKEKVNELENAAKIIKKLIISDGVEPSRIAVVFNLIGESSPMLRLVFASHGIPFNLSDRLTLDKSPVINAITSFLEILENGFYYKNIFRGLSSGYVSKLNVDAYNLQKVFRKHKLISGYEFISKALSDIVGTIPDDKKRDKEQTRKALADIEKIHSVLLPFEKDLTADEFLSRLKKFIYDIGITATLINNLDIKGEENIKAVSSLLESVENVFSLIKTEFGEDVKHSLDFYLSQLRTIIGWVRFNVKERSDYGVQVTSVDEIRGLDFDYVFLAGMNDGNFPSKYSPEIFFAEKFMKLENEHLAEERHKFYSLFKRFRKRLFISYALSENKRELSPSVFLSDLLEVVTPATPEPKFFESVISSENELLIKFGEGNEKAAAVNERFDAENIKRKVAVSEERADGVDSIYNGNLLSDTEAEFSLNENSKSLLDSFKDKRYSITQFEQYAKCPFKYLIERVLRIEPLHEPDEEIEPIEIGNYLHTLLFEFYTTLTARNIDIHDKEAETLLFDLAEKILRKFRFDDESYFYEKEKFFGINGKREDSILYHFLTEERISSDGFIPRFFEVSFGSAEKEKSDKHLSRTEPVLFNGINLTGKIDRIDLKENYISIVDYKTGASKVSAKNLDNGIDLQLPVYMFAARELLGPGYEPGKMNIYSLKFNSVAFGKKEVYSGKKGKKELSQEDKSSRLSDLVNFSLKKIEEYYSNIIAGRFEPSLLNDRETLVCGYCEFKSICRVEERDAD